MNRAAIVFVLAAAVIFWAAALFGHANGFRINSVGLSEAQSSASLAVRALS
jgi:hypothetical protein